MSGPRVFVAPYGPGAAELLRDRVSAAKDGDPLRPVSVLVPTNYVGVSVRRQLATGALGRVAGRGDGIAGLTLLTVYRLAELLGAPVLAAKGRRPVTTPLLGATIRQVLRTNPGIFAPVIDHPSTEQALVRAHRALSELTPQATDALAQRAIERVRDVVRIHRAVRGRLADRWYDEADLMAAAADTVRAGSPVLDDLGAVVVYLPQDLSAPAGDLLRALADATTVEVIAGLTGVAAADADVARSLGRLGVEMPDAEPVQRPVVDQIVSVSDAEEEARSAIDQVLAAARQGIALSRVAVLYPQPEPYAHILAEQLAAADIPWNGAAVRPPAAHVVGRWLLDVLDLPERDYARPAVMDLLTSAPVVRRRSRGRGRHGTAPTGGDGRQGGTGDGRDGGRLPTGTWERISRAAGVVRGRDGWRRQLGTFAATCELRAAQPAAGAPDWVIERDREWARRARQMVAVVGAIIADLDDAQRTTTWRGLAAWCRGMIAHWIDPGRDDWPPAECDAADRVDAALDRLAGLDRAEPVTDLATFRRALATELDDDLGRVGTLGHGVLVGTPASALGVDLDVVVVLGMAEGLTPTRSREDSLLPDAARRLADGQLPAGEERAAAEHRHLLAALAGARMRRVLVYPRGDLRRSTEHAMSRWLADAVEDRSGARALPAAAPWLDTVPSFAARVRRTPLPSTAREYTLRTLADAERTDGHGDLGLPAHPHVPDDAELRRAAEPLTQRAAGRFGRFTGRLSSRAAGLVAEQWRGRVVSPTALELWMECPHAYLLRHVLRITPNDNPEELLQITPLERGDLVHRVLDGWLRDQIAAGVPAAGEPWSADAVAALRDRAARALDDAEQRGVTGHAVLWHRDRAQIAADIEGFVERDFARRRDGALTPTATELAFGLDLTSDGSPALRVDLGDGRQIALRGRIDRVDVAADGTVHVADYKTGSPSSDTTVSSDDPLAGGTRLQLPIYGLAVREQHRDAPGIHTEYWFITHRGRGRRVGYPLTDVVVERLRSALRLVADGIDAGLFPMRPPARPSYGSHVRCAYCDPDGLGTAQRYREWEGVRTDPALRAYVAAVEPDALRNHDPVDTGQGRAS